MKKNDPIGLLEHLSVIMEKLEDKTISIDEAKAQASLVKQSNNLLRYQLDVRKFEHKVMIHDNAPILNHHTP